MWLLSRDRRSLDILSVKKEAKLSSSEISGVEEGKGITNTAIINEITTSRNHRQGIQLDRAFLRSRQMRVIVNRHCKLYCIAQPGLKLLLAYHKDLRLVLCFFLSMSTIYRTGSN